MGAAAAKLKVDIPVARIHPDDMLASVIPFPNVGPDIFSFDLGNFSFTLRWYALAYIVGILIAWRIARRAVNAARLWPNHTAPVTPTQLEDLLTWIIIGIVVGGRLGFVLFYQPAYFMANPAEIPMVWQGGMSFHGGFLGVVAATWWYGRRGSIPILSLADTMAFSAPVGLFLGRLANFVNAELWGRPSDLAWAVIFPGAHAQDCPGIAGLCARHPSQLYEAGLEGLVLGGLLLFLVWRRDWLKLPGQITGVFLAGYGASRFFVEFFRQADAQFMSSENPMGYVIGSGSVGLSMGQLLSLPMILLGIAVIARARKLA